MSDDALERDVRELADRVVGEFCDSFRVDDPCEIPLSDATAKAEAALREMARRQPQRDAEIARATDPRAANTPDNVQWSLPHTTIGAIAARLRSEVSDGQR